MSEANAVGRLCNRAGLGVDIHVLATSGAQGGGLESHFPLSVRSGGTCGVTSVGGYDGETFSHLDTDAAMRGTPAGLVREVEAGSAWAGSVAGGAPPRAYGAGIRIRTTRTFGIVKTGGHRSSTAEFCTSGGLIGGVSEVDSDRDLWTFGCVDANSTVGEALRIAKRRAEKPRF